LFRFPQNQKAIFGHVNHATIIKIIIIVIFLNQIKVNKPIIV